MIPEAISLTGGPVVFTAGLSGNGILENFMGMGDIFCFELNSDGEGVCGIPVKVTFDSDGGTAVEAQKILPGSKATRPTADPDRENFHFMEWYAVTGEDENGDILAEEPYDFTTPVSTNTRLKALWGNEISFEPGVPAAEGAMEPVIVPTGSIYELPSCGYNLEGKTFRAWMVARTGNDNQEDAEIGLQGQEITVTEDLTLTAIWLTVTFDIGDALSWTSQYVVYNSPAEEPDDPVMEGRRFLGWYLSTDEPDTLYDFTQPVTEDITLNASWGYYVDFDAGDPVTTGAMNTVIVREGATYQLPDCDYASEDCVSSQWLVISGGSAVPGHPGDEITVTSNLTVKAVWNPIFRTPDFVLPADTQAIEANAFEGAAMAVVEINSNCASIGEEAFKDCANLRMIRVPKNCEIGENAFSECERVYIFSTADSKAETYCSDPANANCVFILEEQN